MSKPIEEPLTPEMRKVMDDLYATEDASNEALECILRVGRENPELHGFVLRCTLAEVLRTSRLRNSTTWGIGTEAIARLIEHERGERSGAV